MIGLQYLTVVGVLIAIGLGSGLGQDAPHPCERTCIMGEEPMVCEYEFEVEWYVTLSKACYECPFNLTDCYRPDCVAGDGQRRKVITINRQYPGPKIEVCENDTVVVNVINELGNGEGTIIHWHGMEMRGYNHMDGAGRLTQCPIPQFNQFEYEFVAYPSGTYVYHAHYGKQRSDGLAGPLVVKEPQELNPHYDLYDHNCDTPSGDCEITNFITEWMNPDYLLLNYRIFHYSAFDWSGRTNTLVNGRMQYYDATNALHPGETAKTPYEVITVRQGKNYLVRMYGFSVECGYEISVDSHQMLVVAADGYYVEPVEVDVIAFMPGERYDYILRADQPINNYWIRMSSFPCGPGYAVIHYEGAPDADPEEDLDLTRDGVVLNPDYPIVPSPDRTLLRAWQLNSTTGEDFSEEVVDEVHYIGMENVYNDRTKYYDPIYYPLDEINAQFRIPEPLFNNISFLEPKSPPLTQMHDLDPDTFCNVSTIDNDACYTDRCYCTNLEYITLGSTVDIVYVNLGGPLSGGHPMHLHGYHFRVMAQYEMPDGASLHEARELYESGQIPLKTLNPTYRDTIVAPNPGVLVARIKADNPGFWLMHCHIDVHADVGQVMALQVGDVDQMPPPPPDMPTCGDWSPSGGFNNRKPRDSNRKSRPRGSASWTKTRKNEKREKQNGNLKKLFAADTKV